jgi:hypothetical protein
VHYCRCPATNSHATSRLRWRRKLGLNSQHCLRFRRWQNSRNIPASRRFVTSFWNRLVCPDLLQCSHLFDPVSYSIGFFPSYIGYSLPKEHDAPHFHPLQPLCASLARAGSRPTYRVHFNPASCGGRKDLQSDLVRWRWGIPSHHRAAKRCSC